MKKVIVTGANGFIGSWLCKELTEKGIRVFAIVRNENSKIEKIDKNDNIKIIYCELDKISELKNKILDRDIDAFYHLAWSGSGGKDRSDYNIQLSNIKYACDCAHIAKELKCEKFLCSGTITEKIAENALSINKKSENLIYGLAKHTTHYMIDIICKKIDLDYVWMQFANTYGPYDKTDNIINYTLKSFKEGTVPEFSDGNQMCDFIYIKDLVKAIYLLGEKNTHSNFYFLGSGYPRMLKEYLIAIRDAYNEKCEIGLGKRPDYNIDYKKEWFDISKLQQDTGYKSYFTFEEGINETINRW